MSCDEGILYPFPNCVDHLRRAVMEVGCDTELVVADYGSTDWPLTGWLGERAAPVPVRVLDMPGAFSTGGGKNAAALAAQAPVLFVLDGEMEVPGDVLGRGLEMTAQGKAYFPIYRREHGPGQGTYWGSGHGSSIVLKAQWEQNKFAEGLAWGDVDEDTRFAHWFTEHGLLVREPQPLFIHRWHPLWEPENWRDPEIVLPGEGFNAG